MVRRNVVIVCCANRFVCSYVVFIIFIFILVGEPLDTVFCFFSGGTAEHFVILYFSTSRLSGGRGLGLRSSSPCRRGW